jgi:hypothetical protein
LLLLRQHVEPKGLVGLGRAIEPERGWHGKRRDWGRDAMVRPDSVVWESAHWDDTKRDRGERANYVSLQWLSEIAADAAPLSEARMRTRYGDELAEAINWNAPGSGQSLRNLDLANDVLAAWFAYLTSGFHHVNDAYLVRKRA